MAGDDMAGLEFSLSIRDTELFNVLIALVKDVLKDERIPAEVKAEMEARIQEIISDGKEVIEP